MDATTTLSPEALERTATTMGWAQAYEYGITARSVERVRWFPRLAFAVIAILSVWGGAGVFGALVGLH